MHPSDPSEAEAGWWGWRMRSGGRGKGSRVRYYRTFLFLKWKEREFPETASSPANRLASCSGPALRSWPGSGPPPLAAKLGAPARASADKELKAAGRGHRPREGERERERGPRRAQGESLPGSDVTAAPANEKPERGIPALAAAPPAF